VVTPLTPLSYRTAGDSCALSGHLNNGFWTAGPATYIGTEGGGLLNWLALEHSGPGKCPRTLALWQDQVAGLSFFCCILWLQASLCTLGELNLPVLLFGGIQI
jgi:hypothetical protein